MEVEVLHGEILEVDVEVLHGEILEVDVLEGRGGQEFCSLCSILKKKSDKIKKKIQILCIVTWYWCAWCAWSVHLQVTTFLSSCWYLKNSTSGQQLLIC